MYMEQIEQVKIIPRRLISDERGWFLKAITGTEEGIPQHTGEVYLTMGKPGQAKGGQLSSQSGKNGLPLLKVTLF